MGLLLLAWRRFRPAGRAIGLIAVSAVVLFLASRPLPYHHPTAPEAFHALRPAPAHLLAAARFDGAYPPVRFLSISDILFDPGDTAELASIYGDQLDADAFYDFLIATKQKEILAPNLPLVFGLSAVDGYDGGILPLADFVTLQRLLLPDDRVSIDGRLRENLTGIPAGRWLALFNVRFLITDKVGDAWSEGVFYDLQHNASLDAERPAASVATLPPFEATGVGVALSYPEVDPGTPLVRLVARFADGRAEETVLRADEIETRLWPGDDGRQPVVKRAEWPQPGVPEALAVAVVGDPPLPVTIHGISLVDDRDGSFQSLVLSGSGRFRLVHSGDVKIYENLDPLPRAFLVPQAWWAADDEAALARMRSPGFDPAAEVVLSGRGEPFVSPAAGSVGRVTVEVYEPERIVLRVEAEDVGWLVVTDAFYPGWRASVDGEPVDITRANILFRAVPVGQGSHEVILTFRPVSVQAGLVVSLVAGVLWLLALFTVRRAR